MDTQSFFDKVNHAKLIKQLWNIDIIDIKDKLVFAVISKMLKAPVKVIGIPVCRTPQGGILSPLLSGVVVNDLDWWIRNQRENVKSIENDLFKGNVYRKVCR